MTPDAAAFLRPRPRGLQSNVWTCLGQVGEHSVLLIWIFLVPHDVERFPVSAKIRTPLFLQTAPVFRPLCHKVLDVLYVSVLLVLCLCCDCSGWLPLVMRLIRFADSGFCLWVSGCGGQFPHSTWPKNSSTHCCRTWASKRPIACEMDQLHLYFRSLWLSSCPMPPVKSSSSSCHLGGGCADAVAPCTCSPGKYGPNASLPCALAISLGLCGGGHAASSGSACLSLTEVPPSKVP